MEMNGLTNTRRGVVNHVSLCLLEVVVISIDEGWSLGSKGVLV